MKHNLNTTNTTTIKAHKRARPEIIRQIKMAMNKLEYALDEYTLRGLPDTSVESTIKQTSYILNETLRDLSIYH